MMEKLGVRLVYVFLGLVVGGLLLSYFTGPSVADMSSTIRLLQKLRGFTRATPAEKPPSTVPELPRGADPIGHLAGVVEPEPWTPEEAALGPVLGGACPSPTESPLGQTLGRAPGQSVGWKLRPRHLGVEFKVTPIRVGKQDGGWLTELTLLAETPHGRVERQIAPGDVEWESLWVAPEKPRKGLSVDLGLGLTSGPGIEGVLLGRSQGRRRGFYARLEAAAPDEGVVGVDWRIGGGLTWHLGKK